MIQPNEIRIGNIVNYKGKSYEVYYPINERHICLDSEELDEHVYDVSYRQLDPTPLTEEWLLKMGFKNIDCKRKGFSLDGGFIILVLEDDKWDDVSFDVYIKGVYVTAISFVHKLQNLFFSLTSEELKIEL